MQEYFCKETRPAFTKKLSDALQTVGFVAIINTGVNEEIINLAYERLRDFFYLDRETKEQYQIPGNAGQRGYTSLSKETGKNHSIADFKEFLMFGRVLPHTTEKELGYGHNIWPKEIDLKSIISPLYEELNRYSIPLLSALASAINLKEDFFSEMTFKSDTILRPVYYPPLNKKTNKNAVWAKEHTNINMITILPRATEAGLEILGEDGDWIPVCVPKDAFIINVGDQLQNITNGYFHSSRHRVVALPENQETDRLSLALFVHARNNSDLSPIAPCIKKTGGIAKYPTANRQELLMERLAEICEAPPELLQALAESKIVERMIDLNCASSKVMQLLKENGLASEKILEVLGD